MPFPITAPGWPTWPTCPTRAASIASAALAALALAPTAAQASASASAAMTNVHIQLIDLNAADGITPGLSFDGYLADVNADTRFNGAYVGDRQLVTPGAGFGPMSVTNGATFATSTLLAGDPFGTAGPGANVASSALGVDAMGWAFVYVLPGTFTLTANTRMVITATVTNTVEATRGDQAVAYGKLAGYEINGNYFGNDYAQSIVYADGSSTLDPNASLQITLDNIGPNAYNGRLIAMTSAYAHSATPVPEPQTAALWLAGLGLMLAGARRRVQR